MTDGEIPDWYDEDKIVKATFADGYTGWVVDLGDGTCRFANAPLLGEAGPEWGDRVDLFYNPCDPFERPRVGYRIYPEGVEPTGRTFGVKREPTEEEREEHEESFRNRRSREDEILSLNLDYMETKHKLFEAQRESADRLIEYSELAAWVREQGLKIPRDLHSEETRREKDPPTEDERRKTKLFLLATAHVDYADIEVTDDEIRVEVERRTQEDKTARALAKAFEQVKEDGE